MRSTLTCCVLVLAALCGCEKQPSGALKLEVEHRGFRPSCIRVVAWDADSPDMRAETTVPLTPGSRPLRASEQQGSVTVAVFRGADWGERLQVRAEAFEPGGCDAQGQVLAQAPAVRSAEEPVVVAEDGQVAQQVLVLRATDADLDGYVRTSDTVVGSDCDDTRADVRPGAEELCDGLDNNCADGVDEGLAVGESCSAIGVCNATWACAADGTPECRGTFQPSWYPDADGDGQGRSAGAVQSCAQPGGYVSQEGDCNDGDRYTYPGAPEICDARDNDCNTLVDDANACGGNSPSLVQQSINNAPGSHLRSVAVWRSGEQTGVWVVGDSNVWMRKVPTETQFVHGTCQGSDTIDWWSVWADPRSGRAYVGGTNGRLESLDRDNTTCSQPPASVSNTSFTTRGLQGFTLDAAAVRLEGVGRDASPGDSFTWDGQATAQSLRTASTHSLLDVSGLSTQLLFAVGMLNNNLFPIYRFAPNTSGWVRETAPASWTAKELYGVHVVNEQLAYAVGKDAMFLRWNGASWTTIATGTNGPASGEKLQAVLAFGPSSVFVVSASGNFFRYDGSGWEKLGAVGGNLWDIAGTRPDDIWVVGSGGRVYHWPR